MVLTQQEVIRILSCVKTFHNTGVPTVVPRFCSPLSAGEARAAGRLETTMRYLHLTRKGQNEAYRIINSVIGEVAHVRSR